jgi:hypothetical protein
VYHRKFALDHIKEQKSLESTPGLETVLNPWQWMMRHDREGMAEGV